MSKTVAAVGVAMVGGDDGFVYGVGADKNAAIERAVKDGGVSEQCAAMLRGDDVVAPGEDAHFVEHDAYDRDRRCADAFRFFPCTQAVLDENDGHALTRFVDGILDLAERD